MKKLVSIFINYRQKTLLKLEGYYFLNKKLLLDISSLSKIALSLLFLTGLMAQSYEANWESLDSRPTPQWYKDAKFGIFIHWGLYSVPAWGPKGSYAEWYLNGINRGDSLRLEYHKENYGEGFPYRGFKDLFKAEKYNPDKWAELFENAGAKYVVLTSKHHDGFCLWPNPQSKGYNSSESAARRDLLGDLTEAVRKTDVKMGFYYSLYEWDNPQYPSNVDTYVNDYMLPQFKDVVQRYKPSIIFSDGEWDRSSEQWRSEEALAWLYNESDAPSDVVVNDRWGSDTRFAHGGYYSTEYDPNSGSMNEEFIKRGWEECRGIGMSFGYNQNEGPEDYMTSEALIKLLVNIVSRGGNLLLNIGPKSDGTIPKIMSDRLLDIGAWLDVNGEAIYGTTVNRITRTDDGNVQFTLSKDRQTLYAFVDDLSENSITIPDVVESVNGPVFLLGHEKELSWKSEDGGLKIDLLGILLNELVVYTFKIPVTPLLDKPN
jgi:alpha-L-fucosidase